MLLNEEKERARKWLSRYTELEEDAIREMDRATRLKDKAYSLSSSKLSLTPKSKTVINTIEESVVKFMTASEISADIVIQSEMAKREIRDVIDSLSNSVYRRVLKYKYIDNLSNHEIAKRMHYSDSYTSNLLSNAVEDVTQCDKYLSYNIR